MGVFIDGVQRRTAGFTPTSQATLALPRQRPMLPTTGADSPDGLVRRIAAAPAMAPPLSMVAAAPSPIARPLSPGSSWYLPTAVAVATVSIAAGVITRDASNLHTLNLAALLPQTKAVPKTAAVPKPTTSRSATTTPTTLIASQQAMQSVVNQQAAAAGVPTSIVTIDLKTGAVAGSNADTVFTSASLYKLFVADAVYHGIDAGTIHYTDPAGNGTGLNVQDCLTQMITVSSNPCGEALGAMVGWDSQNAGLHAAGYTHTLLRQYASEQTSASDVALLLHKLYTNSLNSPASNAAFISLLKAQQINDRLPVGLPADVTVAHKTGDLNGLAHDAGIIYTPNGNYIAVAMSGPWNTTGQAYGWFANFSDSLYSAFTKVHAPSPH